MRLDEGRSSSTSSSWAAAATWACRWPSPRLPGARVGHLRHRRVARRRVNKARRCPSTRTGPRAAGPGLCDGRLERHDRSGRDLARGERRRGDRHARRRAPQPRPARGAARHRARASSTARRPAAGAAQHRLPRRDALVERLRRPSAASTSTSPSAPSASPRARRWWSCSRCRRSSPAGRGGAATGRRRCSAT